MSDRPYQSLSQKRLEDMLYRELPQREAQYKLQIRYAQQLLSDVEEKISQLRAEISAREAEREAANAEN